jgi:hypothetical protein
VVCHAVQGGVCAALSPDQQRGSRQPGQDCQSNRSGALHSSQGAHRCECCHKSVHHLSMKLRCRMFGARGDMSTSSSRSRSCDCAVMLAQHHHDVALPSIIGCTQSCDVPWSPVSQLAHASGRCQCVLSLQSAYAWCVCGASTVPVCLHDNHLREGITTLQWASTVQ